MNDAEVVKVLSSVGIEAAQVAAGFWSMKFTTEGGEHETLLFHGEGAAYFVAASIIESPILDTRLEQLPKRVLVSLIREASAVLLAKIEYLETDDGMPVYSAVSECSVDGWTGEKLKRRLEATARLAARVSTALSTKG